jgi:hypothetical protein
MMYESASRLLHPLPIAFGEALPGRDLKARATSLRGLMILARHD